jgi:hypothetical protein
MTALDRWRLSSDSTSIEELGNEQLACVSKFA